MSISAKTTNAGTSTIEWLYNKQLRIDDDWSVRSPDGFTWWAHGTAQHIEVIGSEDGPDGNPGYFVRIKTDFISGVTISDQALAGIELLMSTATMSGPVYDSETKLLSLSSLVRVHDGIVGWVRRLVSVAAMLQIADAHFVAPGIAQLTGGSQLRAVIQRTVFDLSQMNWPWNSLP